jgi:hypothetical protein
MDKRRPILAPNHAGGPGTCTAWPAQRERRLYPIAEASQWSTDERSSSTSGGLAAISSVAALTFGES